MKPHDGGHGDVAIATRAGAAIANYTQPPGRAARSAHAWLDTFHSRAQLRAERHQRTAATKAVADPPITGPDRRQSAPAATHLGQR
ncbi:hypothetical protein [Mycobacterium intracellulare]|uniref:hypothetical protein n=1 Tax=Mycobacterium intracellulare TaxID=1767 RepID=UPI0009EC0321|nr:hypothetical protein [Mycobacterium intracellulare]